MGINDSMLERLQALAAESPDDAFFAAVLGVYSGDMSRALDLLLSPGYKAPSYVRGADVYVHIHWLAAADIALRHLKRA